MSERVRWLDEWVRRGRGTVEIGLTENGDVGVWLPGAAGIADGVGDTVAEALEDARLSRLAAQRAQEVEA